MITPSYPVTATERVLPRLALDFTTASLDSRITFTRTTNATNPATYINSSGYVTDATDNEPRFDYNLNTGGSCRGLLIEESRTNLSRYSQAFNTIATGSWVAAGGSSVTADTDTSPANTSTADTLENATGTTFNGAVIYQDHASLTATASYTFSIYIKLKTSTKATIYIRDGNTGGVSSANATATSDWQRVSVTRTVGASSTTFRIFVGNTDGTIALWGSQFELGAFATSYIPTTTTALTRNADVATMTGTNFSDWFNASEGAVFVEASINFTPLGAGGPELYSINSGSSANIFAPFFANATGFLNTNIRSGSASQGILASASAATVGAIFRHCATYKVDSFASSFNAATPATDNLGSVPVGPNILVLGDSSYNGVGNRSRYFRKFFYYPQRLTNAELQAFSK